MHSEWYFAHTTTSLSPRGVQLAMATPVCVVIVYCSPLGLVKTKPVHVCEQFSSSSASYAPRNGRTGPRFTDQRSSFAFAPDRRDWLRSGRGGWPPAEQQYVRVERGKGRVLAARSGRPSRTREGGGKFRGGGPRCASAARRTVHPEGDETILCVSAVRVQGELSLFPFRLVSYSALSAAQIKKKIVHHRSSDAASAWLYFHHCTRRTTPHGAHHGHNGQCTGHHPSLTDSTWL
jgi:hypothetical protein